MNLLIKKLVAINGCQYKLVLVQENGVETNICYQVEKAGGLYVQLDSAASEEQRINNPSITQAVLSFHRARTAKYAPPKIPVKNVPPWFDPTPLVLEQIEAVNDAEYMLNFLEPDGKVHKTIYSVIQLTNEGSSFLGVNTNGDPKITARIYPKDISAAIVDFHLARYSLQ